MRYYLIITSLIIGISSFAQNKQLLYNFNSQPQALMSNPGAAITFEKHIGIPFFSGISIQGGSSGVSVFDIFEEGGDINNAIDLAVNTLSDRDFFTAHQTLEVFSFGWKSRQSEIYFSGGMYQEADALVYYPRDIALLAYRGNASFIGVPFEFSDVSLTSELLSVYHFGINKKVSKKWQLGARAKLYSSIANVNSTSNTGDFITEDTPEGPNILTHRVRNAELTANTSGLGFLFDSDQEFNAGDFIGSAILSGNLGLGVDVGATYTIDDHWTATGSIIDFGFISHRKDVRNYKASGSLIVNGIELEFPATVDGQGTLEYWEELEDQIEEELLLEDQLSNNYTTLRPTRFNGSLQYGFGRILGDDCDCRNSGGDTWVNNAGIQLYSIKRPKAFQGAVTAYFDKKWTSFLQTKFTYTYDAFSATNLGALVSTKIYNFNLYIAADNLLGLPNIAKAQSASLQFGMQLVFDPKE